MPRLVVKKAGVVEFEKEIAGATFSIGRDAGNDVVLTDASVSRHHARLEASGRGYAVVDLDSGNGVKVKGKRVARLDLYPGCEMVIGVFTLVYQDETAAEGTVVMGEGAGAKLILVGGGPQEVFPLAGGEVVLGRSSMSHVPVDDPLASKAHCKLLQQGMVWALVDLGSQNGTLVNGKRVTETEIHHGDQIRIGALTYFFSATGEVPAAGSVAIIQPAHSPPPQVTQGPTHPLPAAGAPAVAAPAARRSLFSGASKGVLLGGTALVIILIVTLGILLRSPEKSTEQEFQQVFQAQVSEQARKQIELHLAEASKHAAAGHLDLALEQYRKVLTLDGSQQQAQAEVVRIEEELRKQAEARAQAEADARARATRIAGLVSQADNLVGRGDFVGARRIYQEALGIDPKNADARAKLVGSYVAEGDALRRRGAEADAQKAYLEALNLDPEDSEAKKRVGDLETARRRARERQERARALMESGLAELKAESYAKAYATFTQILELEPQNARAREFREQAQQLLAKQVQPLYEEGVRLYNEGKLAEAVARFNRALSLYPDHGDTRSFLAKAKDRIRQEAIEIYKKGYIYEGLGRLKEALELYRQTLSLLPDPKEEYHQKAAERVERLKGRVQ